MIEFIPLKNADRISFADLKSAVVPYSYESAWLRMFQKVFPFSLQALEIRIDGARAGVFYYAEMLSRVWGRRLVSLPFADEGGLLIDDPSRLSPELKGELVRELSRVLDKKAEALKLDYIEIRGEDPAFTSLYEQAGFIKRNAYTTFRLNTSYSYSVLRAAFHSNIRTNLKKADKCVVVRKCSHKKDMADVYAIYLIELRRLGGLPLSKKYFELLCEENVATLFLAEVDGRVVGFLFLLLVQKRVLADLNGSRPEYRQYFPKIRLFDAAIRWACDNGFDVFDLMRTRPATGLYEHKKKWGGDEQPIVYYTRIYNKKSNYVLDADHGVFFLPRLLVRHMPLGFLRRWGPGLRMGIGK